MKFSITLLYIAKEALVKQTAFKNILRTEVSSKLFYICCFFPQILSTKPQSYSSFLFMYEETHFLSTWRDIGYSW